MRLTSVLIDQSESRLNPLNEREMCLRNNKIPMIENLGVLADGYDCIDMSHNAVEVIDNVPRMQRLRTLMLSHNRIVKIHPSAAKSLPNLEALLLSYNQISRLSDLTPLRHFKSLETLCLVGNPVTRADGYRMRVLALCPNLRRLDYRRVSRKERVDASKMNLDLEAEPEEQAEAPEDVENTRTQLTEQQRQRLDKIVDAAPSDEIALIESMLAANRQITDDDLERIEKRVFGKKQAAPEQEE
ncbi:MAG: hypothetical protein MHM6MM_005343 [Cercozoa sp. M6MM]